MLSIFYSIQTFAKHLFNLCGINSSAISLPLKVSCPTMLEFMMTLCNLYRSTSLLFMVKWVSHSQTSWDLVSSLRMYILFGYLCSYGVTCLLSLLHSSTALGISIGLTAVVLIQERKEGLIDRTWVAGVNVTEVIASQVITQFFILLVQILLMLVFVLFVFKVNT